MQVAKNLFAKGRDGAMDALDSALDLGAQAIVEGRDAIQNMRSSTEVTNDLAQAIRAVGDELASEGSAEFRVMVEGSSRNVHPILRDEVYAIAREAIRNAFRHAEAKVIEVEITYRDSLRLRIRDDGNGIDPEIAKEGRAGHYGIPGMYERAVRIGGKVDCMERSRGGHGDRIEYPRLESIWLLECEVSHCTVPARKGQERGGIRSWTQEHSSPIRVLLVDDQF